MGAGPSASYGAGHGVGVENVWYGQKVVLLLVVLRRAEDGWGRGFKEKRNVNGYSVAVSFQTHRNGLVTENRDVKDDCNNKTW